MRGGMGRIEGGLTQIAGMDSQVFQHWLMGRSKEKGLDDSRIKGDVLNPRKNFQRPKAPGDEKVSFQIVLSRWRKVGKVVGILPSQNRWFLAAQ